MESPRRNLSAAATTVLLIIIATGMASSSVEAYDDCYHRSKNFKGWCWETKHCADVCWHESDDNLGGACRSFPSRCYCMTFCPGHGEPPAPGTIVVAPRPLGPVPV
ncbi:hypothetical protein BDA96_01G334900 [Sorghum bicolor]|uniref:Knottins-like domain-containing protein n=2 Tax=Sorghum bicolor TaxID=4558 RepID=A0A921S2M3_SORBI|nr:hypothetical protein BDA96_01G334900 [Sorghum bicolor]KXG39004.1 hypothetical protein SORBI_3001G312200 [Sorghum bicolor]